MKSSDDIDGFLNTPQPQQKKEETRSDDSSVWFPIKSIPSKNQQYPKGTVIEGKSVGYRHIKKFALVDESTAIHVMRKIAHDCVRGIDIDDITVEDLRYIFLWLRANSMQDSDFSMTYTCVHCEGTSPLKINPAEFDLEFLNEKIQGIDINNERIDIKLITVAKDVEINNAIDELSKKYEDWDETDSDDVIVSAWISAIDGKPVSVIEAYEKCFVEWSPDNTVQLMRHIKKYKYGLSDTIKTTCVRCRKQNSVAVDFSDLFFFPAV